MSRKLALAVVLLLGCGGGGGQSLPGSDFGAAPEVFGVGGVVLSAQGGFADTIAPPECLADADCDDADPCTFDRCDLAGGTCMHSPGACLDLCTTDIDCDDGNPCTTESCDVKGSCTRVPVDACMPKPCKQVSQCDDGDPCTEDGCLRGRRPADAQAWCNNFPLPNCGP